MKHNKKLISIIAITLAVIIILIIIGTVVVVSAGSIEYRFFTDINSFKKLDEYSTNKIDLSNDNELKELEVVFYYAEEISYEGKNYSIMAYVFADNTSASTYFKKCTGKESVNNWNFSLKSNLFFHSEYIAFYDNCLYRVIGGNYKSFVEVVNFISESFPIDYHDLYENEQTE